jgi:RNA polymerase sigma-70 factor (ECF subfamily)
MTPSGVERPGPNDDEFRRLMQRVRAGCPDAAQEMYDRYSEHIRRVVRRKLSQRLRTHSDSLDFTHDVWASFFRTPREQFTFDDPKLLVKYLSRVAYNKVVDEYRRRFQRQKNDIRLERRLDGGCDLSHRMDLAGRGPTPSQAAIANERWERLLDGQPDAYRVMLEMLRLGHNRAEIAAQTGLHPKMIQRLLQKMAQRRDMK